MSTDLQKIIAGRRATEFVQNGMVVGIGSGSTIAHVIDSLGERVAQENLKIVGVATSEKTRRNAAQLGIPMYNVDDVDKIDLTIDGADQIADDFSAIKGGGAALLWEKIVAFNSRENIWVVDATKRVSKLNQYLPVEVIPYGSNQLFKRFQADGFHPSWRLDQNGNPVRTDSANFLIDLHLPIIENPRELGDELIKMVGVVEHGLFTDVVNRVVIGEDDHTAKVVSVK
ncbi:MAG: ribose-5-phosphate isomerase RpiA [Leuconostoc gelidum]|jgi:ribose 5-phosphate isomerase A|uniref:Ribose-5-phosphate isomerase A n=1 Tax=Leuconostoc gelidum subsp. gelidum TaxID=1607839 RepID=A0ABS7V1B4_LEUGE|nr:MULTISPECIES: ribose-5-phosphate isomerase RpiA [Leuconostoc gelidum group]AFS39705.1 ribose-5-phosphate isomerase A [Leuconostoc gelidum JB7]MBZ5946239.1 ribose-5-phosphate isomerase RpiA [Leuconostoc gasicomitatum]MBZ5964779.1 ribose-5-phosphate isomerase RpiA [Leuconostoc gelidum subsp. gelidum]MBZ5977456.1 ribose-5-phosphate isomerase RpiA [Leuconostoc gelidum subsp. gelidum]MBZ5979253.1 ribose-5-phosphate isomerase RpiA [Leuconostoc gelidum subsp. gelidum]